MKKKAIKIAAASAVAASAFVAAAPLQSEAASNVQSEVSKAVTQIQKAYHTYSDVTAKGQFADLKAVYKEYNAAKTAYANAKALVKKAGGSQKDANLALLDVNYNDFIAKRVVTYIDAYNYGKALEGLKNDLAAALTAKDWTTAEAKYHQISYELKTRTVILDRVYGKTARELLRSEFKASAQELRDSIKNEVTVKMALDAAAKALESKDLATAKTQIEKADAVSFDKNTEMGKALVAYGTAVKTAYEALLTPAVDSVTALNSTQLVVKFNKEIDKTDLAGKFILEGKNLDAVATTVADDNKTVTLTFNNVEGKDIGFLVEPIKTKADAKVTTERYLTKLTYTDVVAPSTSKVEYTYSVDGKTATAKFTFSEPLSSTGVVSVNGVATLATADLAKGEVSVSGLEVGKSYKVDFVGTTDVKGNIANPISQSITVPAQVKDEVKPVAAVSISANTVTLQFSEEVATLGTVTINGGANQFGSFVQDANDKTKYVLDAQAAGALNGVNFLNATVVVDGFKDKAGNAAEKVTTSGTLTADRTAPAFVSAAASADNSKILLTFNDEVKAGDLTSTDELVLKVKDGVTLTNSKLDLTSANVHYGVDLDGKDGIKGAEKNVVAIDYTLTAKSSYAFDVAGKVFADSYNNKVADTLTFSLNVGEVTPGTTTPQAVVNFAKTPTAVGNVITVDYTEDMGDSALVASNYKFAGNALPSGSTLKFVDSRKTVQITLPAGFVTVNGLYVLEATGVIAKDNDTLVNGKVSASVLVGETIAPVATKVNVADSKHLTVDFSESVNAPATVAGVTVKVNGTAVTSVATVVNNKLAIVTDKDFALTDSITVEFKDTNLQDANGNKVANSTISK